MIGELLRKSIHLSGLSLPIIYLFLEKPTMLVIIGTLTGFALTVELVKWLSPDFGAFFFRIFTPLLRKHERKGAMTGATYYLMSAFLCIFLFAKTLAIVCIFFMVLGDMAAALVGKKWGRTKLLGSKSLERECCVFHRLRCNRFGSTKSYYRNHRRLRRNDRGTYPGPRLTTTLRCRLFQAQ